MSIEDTLKEALGDSVDGDTASKIAEIFQSEAKNMVESEVSGLKNNNKKLLDQMAKLKKNQIPDDIDLEAFNHFQEEKAKFEEEQKKLEEQKLAAEGQWESLKMKLQETHNSKLEEITSSKDSEINQLRAALDKEIIENAAIKAIEKEQGNSFFLLPHMQSQMKTVNEDGKFVVKVLDENGEYRTKDDGTPFKIADLVAEMKSNDLYSPAFPSQNSGSGNSINTGSNFSSKTNPWKPETKNITLQAKMIKENPTLADQMKKAAGVA